MMIKIVDDINNWNWNSFQQINKIVIICEFFLGLKNLFLFVFHIRKIMNYF